MIKNQKGFGLSEIALMVAMSIILLGVGVYVLQSRSNNSSSSNKTSGAPSGNVHIEVITGAGGMPPGDTEGEILKNEEFTVVFTEPFPSLERWGESKALKEVTFNNGETRTEMNPGKYGVYYIYKGEKQLYDNLKLENSRNDIQRDKQGPWYVEVKRFGGLKLKFSINRSPV